MSEAAVKDAHLEESKGKLLRLAGLETEAKRSRSTEAFRPTRITINLPEDTSEVRPSITFSVARH